MQTKNADTFQVFLEKMIERLQKDGGVIPPEDK